MNRGSWPCDRLLRADGLSLERAGAALAGPVELHADRGRMPAEVQGCTRAGGIAAGGERCLDRPRRAGGRRRAAGRVRAAGEDERRGDTEETAMAGDVHGATVGDGANRALTTG